LDNGKYIFYNDYNKNKIFFHSNSSNHYKRLINKPKQITGFEKNDTFYLFLTSSRDLKKEPLLAFSFNKYEKLFREMTVSFNDSSNYPITFECEFEGISIDHTENRVFICDPINSIIRTYYFLIIGDSTVRFYSPSHIKHQNLVTPFRITVDQNQIIYVSDRIEGLLIFRKDGKILWPIKEDSAKHQYSLHPLGIFSIGKKVYYYDKRIKSVRFFTIQQGQIR
jgi:hypothetical protein